MPDLPAPLWSAEYAANRDPALEAILRYVPDPASAATAWNRREPAYLARQPR